MPVRPMGNSDAASELGIGATDVEKLIRLGKIAVEGDPPFVLIDVDFRRVPKCMPVAPPITKAFHAIQLHIICQDTDVVARLIAELQQIGFTIEGINTAITPTTDLKVPTVQELEDRLRAVVKNAKVRIVFEGYKKEANETFF